MNDVAKDLEGNVTTLRKYKTKKICTHKRRQKGKGIPANIGLVFIYKFPSSYMNSVLIKTNCRSDARDEFEKHMLPTPDLKCSSKLR